ncbi:beta-galactosidase [Enterococcus massiliensis]|uniref:beta-galactosidase n=1 Tax=Enterococcus massiliensis TaxID=1640685 RepID=UPI00065DE275|nr:beta-galactosidase [Enterococcus massiliensis]
MVRFDLDHRLLHGGDYNPDQWLDYPDILKKDIELMQQAHVNTVTLGVFAWSALEPKEGKFCFDWMDEIFDQVSEFGGNIILATPSGGRPQWLSQAYPEVNRTDALGQKHTHGFRHNHCYSSPIYREKVQRINRKLAERYGSHPALSMWHVSNEYSGECFCPYCQESWRKWLQKKYGSLEAINQAWLMSFWGSTYSDWAQVLPPSPLGEHKVHGMDLDWKRFVTDRTIDFYQAEIEPLREITPNIPVTTNFMAEGYDTRDFIPLEGLDYGKFSKYVDIVSWDSYPDWHNNYESLEKTAMKSAYVHDQYWSLKQQPFLVMESTPSEVNSHPFNKSKRPGMHILSAMQQIAHGSDSTLYFQWRQSRGNSEKFHGGVVGHDGSAKNRVFQEVSEYGKRLEKLSEVKGTTKKSKVAILFDWESNWALKRGGGFGRPTRRYPQTLQEHYSIFWEKDISVDILSVTQDFSKYDLVIAPMLYLMTGETMTKLQEYVAAGGTLIASYFTGMVNETDLVYLGGLPKKLQALFGIDVLELDTLYENEHNMLDYQGKMYQTKDYSAILAIKEAQVLGRYHEEFYEGTPAVVTHAFGKGDTYYLAARTNTDFLRAFYEDLIEKLQLKNTLIKRMSPVVSIQSRYSKTASYHFFMNFSTEIQSIEITRSLIDAEKQTELPRELLLAPYEVIIGKESL